MTLAAGEAETPVGLQQSDGDEQTRCLTPKPELVTAAALLAAEGRIGFGSEQESHAPLSGYKRFEVSFQTATWEDNSVS